jgi:hypothetical protein
VGALPGSGAGFAVHLHARATQTIPRKRPSLPSSRGDRGGSHPGASSLLESRWSAGIPPAAGDDGRQDVGAPSRCVESLGGGAPSGSRRVRLEPATRRGTTKVAALPGSGRLVVVPRAEFPGRSALVSPVPVASAWSVVANVTWGRQEWGHFPEVVLVSPSISTRGQRRRFRGSVHRCRAHAGSIRCYQAMSAGGKARYAASS